jgi:hypothetical protein
MISKLKSLKKAMGKSRAGQFKNKDLAIKRLTCIRSAQLAKVFK